MRRLPPALFVVALLVVPLMTASPASAAVRSAPDRATWVWDRPDPATLVDFLAGQGVDDVFVSTPGDLADDPDLAWFEDLRARTRAVGIGLQALGAETDWLDHPAAAIAWQRQALATGLFDGVHLDVEPWQHRQWSTHPSALLRRYVGLLGGLAADTDAPVEADIPFWLDRYRLAGHRVDETVLGLLDAVTVMSYRDTVTGADSITDVAAPALAAADRAGKPARLAVETHDLGSGRVADKQTFYGSTRATLTDALAAVDRAERSHPAYRGIAVHDATGWAALAG